jgi:hypothetical protein
MPTSVLVATGSTNAIGEPCAQTDPTSFSSVLIANRILQELHAGVCLINASWADQLASGSL